MNMGRYDFKYPDHEAEPFDFDSPTITTAIGETVVNFEELDEQLSTAISFLLGKGDEIGRIVTAELSFRGKVNLFGALFRHVRPRSDNLDELRDLSTACLQIEEKRNQVVHSKWRHNFDGPGMIREKYTARGKHGLQRQAENLNPHQVDAIWAHCGYLAHLVDELMYIEFGLEYGQP